MATQEVVYKIKADNNQAVQAFNDLSKAQGRVEQSTKKLGGSTQSSNMMLMSTSRIIQDMPFGFMAVGNNITFLAEQMSYAKTQGMSFKDQLVGMGKSLIGPGGMIFAISAITSAITYFTMNVGRGKSSVDTFTSSIEKAIKKLIDFQDPLKNLKFGLTPDELNALIPAIDKEIKALEDLNTQRQINVGIQSGVSGQALNSSLFLNQLTDKEKERQKINEQMIEQLKQVKSEYEAQLKVSSILESLGLQKVKDEEKVRDILKEQKIILEDIVSLNMRSRPSVQNTRAFPGGMTPALGPNMQTIGLSDAEVKRDFLKENQMLVDTIKTSADVLRSEFSSAWQSIFGEADTLFEKLLMNISEKLTSNWLTELGGGLLNWLVPGLGSAAGMAFGSSAPMIQNKIVISDREIATIYSMGREQASRLRI